MSPTAGVIGGGSFGTAIANLLAENLPVRLYIRNPEAYLTAQQSRRSAGQALHPKVSPCAHPEDLHDCTYWFLMVPSQALDEVWPIMQAVSGEDKVLVHGIKGLYPLADSPFGFVTVSEAIQVKSAWKHMGCLAGPNLAREIALGKPAATVVASLDDRVLHEIPPLLKSSRFQVLLGHDLRGIELCGVLKNIMAIAAGALHQLELGENAKALLINRAMVEMVHLGLHLGGKLPGFLGVAGLGDLIATCSSPSSRNFTVGAFLAQGKTMADIGRLMEETAEGIATTQRVYQLAEERGWKAPITKMVYKVLYEDLPVETALQRLMKLPLSTDVDFV